MESNNIRKNILIVDDNPNNLKVLSETLTKADYEVRAVTNGKTALTATRTMPPDLILLDIMMPQIDGYQVCQELKADAKIAEIPIIFLSALDEVLDKVKAFEVGGVDYITKPFQVEEVLARVKNHLALQSAKTEISQLNAKLAKLNAKLEQRVEQRTQYLLKKIDELESTKNLLHHAFYDELTQLPNRALFAQHVDQALDRLLEWPDYSFAVLLIGCEQLKSINDSLGSQVGDRLLVSLVTRLQSSLSPEDCLARFGEDEFAILLPEVDELDSLESFVDEIDRQFKQSFTVDEHQIELNINTGIVKGTMDYDRSISLLRDAKRAMLNAKKLGHPSYIEKV